MEAALASVLLSFAVKVRTISPLPSPLFVNSLIHSSWHLTFQVLLEVTAILAVVALYATLTFSGTERTSSLAGFESL